MLRIFVHKKDKEDDKANHTISFTLHKILLGHERKTYEMGGSCGTHER
jgi:hypothetical protein